MLNLRIITATILILATFGSIFYLPPWVFNSIVVLLMAIGTQETASMFWPQPQHLSKRILFVTLAVVVATTAALFPHIFSAPLIWCGGVWWLAALLLLVYYVKHQGVVVFNTFTKFLIGLCTFIPFAVAFNTLHALNPYYLLYVMILVWANDSGAYFAGTLYGKNLLAPTISPKKTLEGLGGGMILGVVVIICGGFLLKIHGIKWGPWVALGVVSSLWSVIGDLFESMLKRQAAVKDSGSLLPGHGGVYDRVDSLTAALPLFALGVLLIGF